MSSAKYCTGCGRVLRDKVGVACSELYDQELYAKSGILKLVGCADCDLQVADKYVEADGVLLLIDLVLQSKPAYRHVLLNGGRNSYTSLVVKMALLTVLCDGYIGWSNTAAGRAEFFEQEYEFYLTCAKVILALLGFLTTVMTISWLNCGVGRKFCGRTLLFGLLLSYSSRSFNLMALLWSTPQQQHASASVAAGGGVASSASSYVMWGFVYLLFTLSSVRVHQVTQESRSALSSWIHLFMGHIVFVCLLNLDQLLEDPLTCSA